MNGHHECKSHIKIWRKDFCKLNLANFILAMSVYMQLPIVVEWMKDVGISGSLIAIAIVAYGVGLFSLGTVCSYLIQKYRRNKVCMLAMLCTAACMALAAYTEENPNAEIIRNRTFFIVVMQRFILGASFGLAYMIMNSTLIVDCCESSSRTFANFVSASGHRLSVVLGPLAGILLYDSYGVANIMYLSSCLSLTAILLLLAVSFPFKTPEETVRLFSLDRFFLPKGMHLFIPNTVIVAVFTHMLLTFLHIRMLFLMLCGYAAVLIIYSFFKTPYQSFKVSFAGYALTALGVIIIMLNGHDRNADCLAVAIISAGMSLLTVKHQLTYIDISGHCKRGTSQSTYFLSFESGVTLGLLSKYFLQ